MRESEFITSEGVYGNIISRLRSPKIETWWEEGGGETLTAEVKFTPGEEPQLGQRTIKASSAQKPAGS